MKKYRITYNMERLRDNIVVVIGAKSEEDAIIFAKMYRKDGFSIEEVKGEEE